MMQASKYELLIQLDMEELSSKQTVTTFRFIKSKGDILTQFKQCIDNDIETVYTNNCSTKKETYSLCDYKPTTKRNPV